MTHPIAVAISTPAAPAPNVPSTTVFIGQASGTTFLGPTPITGSHYLMAAGYEEFAQDDLATAERLLPAAVETLGEA